MRQSNTRKEILNGLYIHIPFCRSKCIYCDFYSVPRLETMQQVVEGLIKEYSHRRNEIDAPFDTIYFGGGTPSIIPVDLLWQLVEKLPLQCAEEITIEVNPDDVTIENAREWQAMGFNRVSMGVQSLDDDTLRWMRRRHASAEALQAIDTLHAVGIDNISCDLIYGIPDMSETVWKDSLTRLLDSEITHLSAYCLTYSEGTALDIMYKKGKATPPTDVTIERQFRLLRTLSAEAGFEHYEISNLCRPGKHSRHNSIYWSATGRWLGIGPSAHSFDGHTRRIDIPDIKCWLQQLPYPVNIDDETPLDRVNDIIVSSLRTAAGLDLEALPDNIANGIISDAQRFIENGQMKLENNHLRISAENWLISDSFIRELIRL